MRPKDEKGLILIDILIVILIAGIIAAILVPQYAQKREREQTELCRQNMISLADVEGRYYERAEKFASDIGELSVVVPEVGGLVCPKGGLEYSIALQDSLSYVITCPHGHGDVRGDTTETKMSWEK
ncbi:MAG: hypothetical protein ACE5OR_03915 [bacterium]